MPALLRRIVQVPTSASETHIGNEFDKFGPLKRVPIRTPPKKDQLTRLRELRDSLNSGNLTPEQLLNRMVFHPNLNAFEAVELAEREGMLIAPNIIHDRILTQTDAKYSTWTGTLIIYEKPNQPFGDSVLFNWTDENVPYSLSFQIPEEHRGRVNCALVIEYPDFTFVRTGENKPEVKLTEGAVVNLVENFPKENGWYAQNEFDVPNGSAEAEHSEKRYLLRKLSCYLGLLVRLGDFGGRRQNVAALYGASGRLGVALIS